MNMKIIHSTIKQVIQASANKHKNATWDSTISNLIHTKE